MDEDWELLLSSPKAAAAAAPYAGGGEDDAGAIKHDYFDLGSDAKYPRRASLSRGDEEEEEEDAEELLADSSSASWVEPDPDDLAFPGRDRAALWSDSSSDGERPEVEAAEPVEWATEEAAAEAEGAVAKEGGAVVRWWKLPLDALRVWVLRAARSAWSVPFAIALLAFAVLGRRLYRMRRQSKAVARVRLVLDEKKASQLKGQASRLNESMMVRQPPRVKPMLPANGVTPWPVLGHL